MNVKEKICDRDDYWIPCRDGKMTKEEAIELSSAAWCTGKNKFKVMDVDLALAFADILMREVNSCLSVNIGEKNKCKDVERFMDRLKDKESKKFSEEMKKKERT